MTNAPIRAEQAGSAAFRNGLISSYTSAEHLARKTYTSVLERECFVAGWNRAFWDEQGRVLSATRRED